MKIITALGEGLGKLLHSKKSEQVLTNTMNKLPELPESVQAEIQEASRKMKSGIPATDTLAFSTSTQAQESILEKIEGLKGLRLASLEIQAKIGAPESVKNELPPRLGGNFKPFLS